MSQIIWNDYFSVGVQQMDLQHQKFIEMLNQCLKAQTADKLASITPAILSDMMAYLQSHFAAEEKMMAENAYPGYDAHVQLHRAFIQKTNSLLEKHRQGNQPDAVAAELLDFLQDWFINHIIRIDKQYTDEMHSKGIK